VSVKIYQLDKAFSFFIWLCDACAAARKKAGYQVKGRKTVDWKLTCDDCPRA